MARTTIKGGQLDLSNIAGDGISQASGVLSITTAGVTNAMLADDAVDSDELVAGAVDLAHMSVNSIDSDQYVDGSIDLVHMSANSVDSDQYVDGSIDTAHIADNQVTLAKMAGLARGKIIYGDASGDPAALAAGANGKVLVADANGDPSWTTLSGDATLSAGALTIAADSVENSMLANITRGSVKVGGASDAPTDLDAKTSGQILVGDGTDIASVAVSGDATLASTGAVTLAAAQTNVTSLLATDIKIGEDDETKIDFETDDEIHFYAANAEQVYVADGVFGPQTDSDVDLGTTGVRFKDAYVDSLTTTNDVAIGGNLTVAGTTTTENTTIIESTVTVLQFEGASDNAHETTFKVVEPTADASFSLPALSAGNYFIPALADTASDASAAVTAAEFALLDGGSSVGTTAVADGDGIFTNDNGTMKHTTVQTFQTYFDANSVGGTSIVTVGTIGAGTWQGTKVASAFLDDDTAHLSTSQTFLGAKNFGAATQFGATVTVGQDDAGYDVQFFGDTASAYMLWDTSADDLILAGAARLVVPEGQLVLGSAAVDATAAEIDHLDGIADAVYDQTADSVVFFDANNSCLKYDAANDFAGAVAGDGLRAASGKLKFNQGWNVSGSQQLGMDNLKYSFNEALEDALGGLSAMVFVNGILQHSGSNNDYTAAITTVSGSDKMVVTFNSANQGGDLVTATYLYAQS